MLLRSEKEVAMVSISHCLQAPEGNLFCFCQRQALGEPMVLEAWKPTEVDLKVRVGGSVSAHLPMNPFLGGNPCSLGRYLEHTL